MSDRATALLRASVARANPWSGAAGPVAARRDAADASISTPLRWRREALCSRFRTLGVQGGSMSDSVCACLNTEAVHRLMCKAG